LPFINECFLGSFIPTEVFKNSIPKGEQPLKHSEIDLFRRYHNVSMKNFTAALQSMDTDGSIHHAILI